MNEVFRGTLETSRQINNLASDAAAEKAAQNTIEGMLLAGVAGMGLKIKKINLTTPADGAEQPTGFELPARCMVLDVLFQAITPEATGAVKSFSIGTVEGSGQEFGVAMDAAAVAGTYRPQASVTAGATETYFSANNRGSALCDYSAGSDVAGDHGLYREKADLGSGGREIAWTPGSADWAEFTAALYIIYLELI
jgi:hypothetical protein